MTAPTAEFASLVFGPEGVGLDDPAETFHEASTLYPGVAPGRLLSTLALARDPAVQETLARASLARPHLPGTALPEPSLRRARLHAALASRRSRAPGERVPLRLGVLATVLGTAYRSRDERRPVPSGGALYPLELYTVALEVDGLDTAVYHYSPYHHRLARLGSVERRDVAATLVDPALAERASALVVVTSVFWRTRFKYGQRGYRFALLEAGHVMQNALLAAAAARVSALPLGGFYDRGVDALVGADGLHEASLYLLLLGGNS